jgi:4-aminobutyrate aminotransferase/(S)-3-amino-2-methylpropionate transaminase
MTGKVVPYKVGVAPMPGGVWHVPFPNDYHCVTPEASLFALEQLFKSDCAPSDVAAIVIEPVQGEGGFYIAPADFLKRLRAICDEHGIVLVADEIQAGFARTGKMFAIEHSGVVPDLITVAKSLAGGLPLSGVIGKAEIMDAPGPGGLGGTYGGNAVSCAAALAVLDVIEKERLCERSSALGERMVGRLRSMSEEADFACLGEVRGLGAMVAVELVKDRETHEPWAELAKSVSQHALQQGLVLLPCGLYGNVLRFLVPLTADEALVDEGLDLLAAAIRAAVAEA